MDVGAILREARLQAGLSPEDISQRTKIHPAKIEALEASAFESLPQGIYLDGLVRAYTAEVGLDGRELVARLRETLVNTPSSDVTAFDEFPSEEGLPDDRIPAPAHHDVSPYHDVSPHIVVPAEPVAHPTPKPHAISDIGDTPLDIGDTPLDIGERPPLDTDVVLVPAQRQRRRVSGLLIPALVLIASVGLGAWLYDRSRPFAEREQTDVPALAPRADSDATGTTPSDPSGTDATRTTRDPGDNPADAVRADGGASTSAHHTSETPPSPSPAAPAPPAPRTPATVAPGAPDASAAHVSHPAHPSHPTHPSHPAHPAHPAHLAHLELCPASGPSTRASNRAVFLPMRACSSATVSSCSNPAIASPARASKRWRTGGRSASRPRRQSSSAAQSKATG